MTDFAFAVGNFAEGLRREASLGYSQPAEFEEHSELPEQQDWSALESPGPALARRSTPSTTS